jgi:putative transposase
MRFAYCALPERLQPVGRNKRSALRRVSDWPHSSFHRDVRVGLFPEDWAGDVSAAGSFGGRI